MDIIIAILVGSAVCIIFSISYFTYLNKKQKRDREFRRTEIYRRFAADFAHAGWPSWGYSSHTQPGQRERMQKGIYSKSMKLLEYDLPAHTARVLGEHGTAYDIDGAGCSCMDFRTRGLPCKHMYFAVIELSEKN